MVMFYGACSHCDVFMENATMVMFYGECDHGDVLWRMLPW